MLANYHTHTDFCDGNNTPEEVVLYAIDKKFDVIGFSGHGYTPFDLKYCVNDMQGYISEIKRIKEKYKSKIQICLGIEEEIFTLQNRQSFEYMIGSSHYFCVGSKYYPIDSNYECFKECLEVFEYDIIKLAKTYYETFCDYILKRKPDIIGHFDLITKFDEIDGYRFLKNEEYLKMSEHYIGEALKSEAIFEVNTGAISRGFRTAPYPHENLLHIMKKNDAKLILSSDSHAAETIDFHFEETKKILRDAGFEYVYVLHDGTFKKDYIK